MVASPVFTTATGVVPDVGGDWAVAAGSPALRIPINGKRNIKSGRIQKWAGMITETSGSTATFCNELLC